MILRFLALFLVFLTCSLTRAQETIYYDDNSGLASSRVGGVVQDYRGLIWVGTWCGLNMYDGYTFHWLKIRPGDGNSLTNDRLRSIRKAPNGNIWVRTDRDIYEFNVHTFQYQNIPASKKAEIRKLLREETHELRDKQDNLWVADSIGLNFTVHRHHPAKMIPGTEAVQARALFMDKWQRLWIGTRQDYTLRIYSPDGELESTIPIGRKIYCITQMPNNDMWMGCKPGGLIRISSISSAKINAPLNIQTISTDSVYDIQRDKKGRLWLACFRNGLKCCPNPMDKNPVLTHSFSSWQVRKVLITNEGNIVAATSDGVMYGRINEQDINKTVFRTIIRDGKNPEGLANSATMDLVQDKEGNIYIGTESSGIDMINERDLFPNGGMADPKSLKFRHFNDETSSITTDFCRSMVLLNDSTLMIVGTHTMMLFYPKSDRTITYNRWFWNTSCHFAEGKPVILPDDRIVFGTDEGAYIVKRSSMYSRGYIPPLLMMYVTVNGGEPDYQRVLSDTLQFKANERNITIGYAALDFRGNKGILYRTRLDDSPWTNASALREVTLFDLEPGTHLLHVQSTDRYGRWVENEHVITIIVDPHWYETWWAYTLMILLALGFIGSIIYTQYYIKSLKRQRRDALDNYMALIAQTSNKAAEKDSENNNIVSDKDENSDNAEKKAPLAKTVDSIEESTKRQPQPMTDGMKMEDQWFLDRVRMYIEENLSNSDANIDDMATVAATSRSTLNRRLNSIIGITAAQLLIDARMQHAAHLISNARKNKDQALSVTDIAFKCGYTDPKYFSRCFKQKYGVAPSEYKS